MKFTVLIFFFFFFLYSFGNYSFGKLVKLLNDFNVTYSFIKHCLGMTAVPLLLFWCVLFSMYVYAMHFPGLHVTSPQLVVNVSVCQLSPIGQIYSARTRNRNTIQLFPPSLCWLVQHCIYGPRQANLVLIVYAGSEG